MARRFVRTPPSGRAPQNRAALSPPGAVRRAPPQGPRHPPRKPGFVYHLLWTGRRIPGSSDVWTPVRGLADPAGALAVEVKGAAARDPVEPGGEAPPRRVEGVSRTPYLQEDLLDQIFS